MDQLPPEADPAEVRKAAWRHAWQAHTHAREAERQAARVSLHESRRLAGMARMEAEVACALMACLADAPRRRTLGVE
jgi:hypothetical protein